MGDFNAKLCRENEGVEHVMGKHGIGGIIENGGTLIDFCDSHDMVIGGTIFSHRNIHKTTWIAPDGHTENQNDHINVNKKIEKISL
jgi:hypothetical protein